MKQTTINKLIIFSFLFSFSTCYAATNNTNSIVNSSKPINQEQNTKNPKATTATQELENKKSNIGKDDNDPIIATYGDDEKVKESDIIKWMISSPQFNANGKYKTLDFAEYTSDEKEQIAKQYIISKILEKKIKESAIEKDPKFQSYLDQAKQTLLTEYFLQQNVPDLRDSDYTYYQRQLAKDKIKISHILVNDEETAKLVKERLSKGETFNKLAAELSLDEETKKQGGLVDQWITENELPEALNPVLKMKEGEVSEPIKVGEKNWIIVKLNSKALHVPSRDEVRKVTYQYRVMQYVANLQNEAKIKILIGDKNDNKIDDTKSPPVDSAIPKGNSKLQDKNTNSNQSNTKLPTTTKDIKKDNIPSKNLGNNKAVQKVNQK